MIDEWVKNHTEQEVIKHISQVSANLSSQMQDALRDQNMYMLSASVTTMVSLNVWLKELDKKVNGPKSKVI